MSQLRGFFRPQRKAPLDLCWITPELAIAAAPRDSDWPTLVQSGLKAVLDLRAEADDNEALVTGVHGLHYLRLAIPEYEAPWLAELSLMVEWAVQQLEDQQPLLIHCREGRGRSALVACAVIVKLGMPLQDAFQMVMKARPRASLSRPQEELLQRFAGTMNTERGPEPDS